MTTAPPFFAALAQRARACNSLLCVGLDPHPDQLPQPSAAAARDYCLRLIAACAPFACAFKPNSAFFEVHGAAGMQALAEVIAAVPAGIPVVLDAKRGDIASTAAAYARAAFDTLGAHAITASPYLGADSIAPFTARADRGVFVLCKTSNPGAGDLQLLPVDGEPLFMQVARRAPAWSQSDNIGLVMGATDVAALAQVRAADSWSRSWRPARRIRPGLRWMLALYNRLPIFRAFSEAAYQNVASHRKFYLRITQLVLRK